MELKKQSSNTNLRGPTRNIQSGNFFSALDKSKSKSGSDGTHDDSKEDPINGGGNHTEDSDNLTSKKFSGNAILEAVYDGKTITMKGASGGHVKLIQEALIEQGFKLPKYGADGIFGNETRAAVMAYQQRNNLKSNGIVNQSTIRSLDKKYNTGPVKPEDEAEISATAEALGFHIATGMIKANEDPKSSTSGIHYAESYRSRFPNFWKSDYGNGYANPDYWDRIGYMTWRLKPNVSASAGIKSWLKGLTIAECFTTVVAVQIDAIRAAMGDAKFDEKYGSGQQHTPAGQRLSIRMTTEGTILDDFLVQTEESAAGNGGSINNRPVQKGDWYYFENHPKYLLKHPAGAFQGENAVYLGRNEHGMQLWSGLGLNKRTENQLYDDMVSDYNRPRNSSDRATLEGIRADNGGVLPPEYDAQSGFFPNRITRQDILTASPYTIDGVRKTGGFLADVGYRISAVKVQQVKGEAGN